MLVFGMRLSDSALLYITQCPPWEVPSPSANARHRYGPSDCILYTALSVSVTYSLYTWKLVAIHPLPLYFLQQLLECNKCRNSYHPECLGPNYPTKPTKKKKVWVSAHTVLFQSELAWSSGARAPCNRESLARGCHCNNVLVSLLRKAIPGKKSTLETDCIRDLFKWDEILKMNSYWISFLFQICTKCVRCKSCGSTTPGKGWDAQWSHDFSLCHDCAKLFAKGTSKKPVLSTFRRYIWLFWRWTEHSREVK